MYWLIVFVFTSQGDFMYKDEYQIADGYQACLEEAAEVSKQYVNTPSLTNMFCVTDDHYMGRDVDENIPLDFNEYEKTFNPLDSHSHES